jgi:transcriptional regulator with XRE-family HTH domain
MQSIGQRVRELRKERGLPLDVLAYKARCGNRTLILLECWNLPPRRRDVRERIADALGVSYEELWGELEQQAQQGGATQS